MASQGYIGRLYEAQAELVLQRNNLWEIGVRQAWEFIPKVDADIKAKVAIIEKMLDSSEPPRTRRDRKRCQGGESRWERLTKLDADQINATEDLVYIAVTAVGTILNEVESVIERHVPSTSSSFKKARGTSVKWGAEQVLEFDTLHAPASLTQREWPKYWDTEVSLFSVLSVLPQPLPPNQLFNPLCPC